MTPTDIAFAFINYVREMFLPLDLLKLPGGKKRRAQITTVRKKISKRNLGMPAPMV